MVTFLCHYWVEDFSVPSENLLLNHIRLVHSSEPGFSIQCTVNGCSRTFKNFRTYQNHKHNQAENQPISIDDGKDDQVDNQDLGFQQADDPGSSNNSELLLGTDDMQ